MYMTLFPTELGLGWLGILAWARGQGLVPICSLFVHSRILICTILQKVIIFFKFFFLLKTSVILFVAGKEIGRVQTNHQHNTPAREFPAHAGNYQWCSPFFQQYPLVCCVLWRLSYKFTGQPHSLSLLPLCESDVFLLIISSCRSRTCIFHVNASIHPYKKNVTVHHLVTHHHHLCKS